MARLRAQSEVIGVVLLIGVVVSLVAVVSVVVLSNVATEQPPVADLRIESDETTVTVTHLGGEGLQVADLTVIVRGTDGQTQYIADRSDLQDDDGDDAFEFGEAMVQTHGRDNGEGRVILVHRPTNEIIEDETVSFSSDG
jgi:flagellin-like protein